MTEPSPILVLGESGQLARCLVDQARATGLDLTCFGRRQLDIVRGDLVFRVLRRIRPRAVINAAAYTAVDRAEANLAQAMAVNALGVENVATAAASMGIPMIHLSSDYVFDGSSGHAYVESDEPAPVNAYGRSKLEGERAFLRSGVRGTIIRTSWVYSPYGRNFLTIMMHLGRVQEEVRVVFDQLGRPTFARDLAAACLLLAQRWVQNQPAPRILHYSGAEDASWADLASEILEQLRPMTTPIGTVIRIQSKDYAPIGAKRPIDTRLNTSLASSIGLPVYPWRERVRVCVAERLKLANEAGA